MRETVTKTKLKNNQKGITLIALVITIIVLLILAGVAISMLSGENGILKQAANAKVETEEAQDAENKQLKSMELIMDIQTSNNKSQLKVANGFMTNVEPGTKVGEMVLPEGYSIYSKEGIGDTPVSESDNVTTGMIVAKNGEEFARIVIYGDINCDGLIEGSDATEIKLIYTNRVSTYKEWQIIAADVNHDGEISDHDAQIVLGITVNYDVTIDQTVEAKSVEDLIIVSLQESIDKYLKNLPEDFKIVWKDQLQQYYIYIDENTIDVGTFLSYIENDTAIIQKYNEDDEEVELDSQEYIQKNDFLSMSLYGEDFGLTLCITFKIKS